MTCGYLLVASIVASNIDITGFVLLSLTGTAREFYSCDLDPEMCIGEDVRQVLNVIHS